MKKVSIIIVNFNGIKWLDGCLGSLDLQTYKKIETIFVDNGSTDGSVKFVKKRYPKTIIIQNNINLGFSEGNNVGYRHSTGEYIILLNNDTIVERDYVKSMVDSFSEIKNLGIAQSKIVKMSNPSKIDSCGSFLTSIAMQYYFGNGKDEALVNYSVPTRIFSVKGASVIISRKMIEQIGLFDEKFWCYYEETDLCHRAWLTGWECWYWPRTKVRHFIGGTSTEFANSEIQFHNVKNKLRSIIKNFSIHRLLYQLFCVTTTYTMVSIGWLISGKVGHSTSLIKAIAWNVINLGETLDKRKSIQKLRKLSDSKYLATVSRDPRLEYYKFLFLDKLEKYHD